MAAQEVTTNTEFNVDKHLENLQNENKFLEEKIKLNNPELNSQIESKRNQVLQLENEVKQLEEEKQKLPENELLYKRIKSNELTIKHMKGNTSNAWTKRNPKVYEQTSATPASSPKLQAHHVKPKDRERLPEITLAGMPLNLGLMVRGIEDLAKTVHRNDKDKYPTKFCKFDDKCKRPDGAECGYAHPCRGENALFSRFNLSGDDNMRLSLRTFGTNRLDDHPVYEKAYESTVITALYHLNRYVTEKDEYIKYEPRRNIKYNEEEDNYDDDITVITSKEVVVESSDE